METAPPPEDRPSFAELSIRTEMQFDLAEEQLGVANERARQQQRPIGYVLGRYPSWFALSKLSD